jgi:6-phosphogluconolactonase
MSRSEYVGYISFRMEDRVSIFRMDPDTGKVTWQKQVAVEGGPGPMALDPHGNFLYVGNRKTQRLTSYRIDRGTGDLSLAGSVPLQGEPVGMEMDRTGRFILSAHFYQSTAAVHAVDESGVIAFPPVEWRYTAYGPHSIYADRSNRFVFLPHVARSGGPNAIAQFKFDAATGRLTPNTPPFLQLHDYEGPRHMAFHPSLDVLYTANEQGANATAYRLDPASGTLTNFQTIWTVPEDFTPADEINCSEIKISPDGRFLFVVTRGHNSISSFSVDPATGGLALADRVPTEPDVRPFCLDPEGRFAMAAGGGMANYGQVVTYRIDAASGRLTPLETHEGGKGPMWILIMRLDED